MTWGGFSAKGSNSWQPSGGVENFFRTPEWGDFGAQSALTLGKTEAYNALFDNAKYNAELLSEAAQEAAGIAADGKIFGSNMNLWGDLANTAGSFAGIGLSKGLFGGGGEDGLGITDIKDYPISGRRWTDRIW